MTATEILENQDIEIFKTGTFNGFNSTVELIDEIIANTDIKKAANVLHHPNKTTYSLADFAELKRVDNKLFARLKNVTKEFAESVKTGLFPSRSIRLMKGNNGWFLEHLGWLPKGVEAGVDNLASVKFEKENKTFEYKIKNKFNFEEHKMDKDYEAKLELLRNQIKDFEDNAETTKTDTQTKIDELLAKIETLTAENAELKKTIADAKDASFEKIIISKTENLKVKKDEAIKELKELSSHFDEVKDFEKIVERMQFETKVEVKTGESEDFQKKTDSKDLVKDFSLLIEDEEKAKKFQKENPKEYAKMWNAYIS